MQNPKNSYKKKTPPVVFEHLLLGLIIITVFSGVRLLCVAKILIKTQGFLHSNSK